ncbi:MAG: hypothetical protein WD426_15980 [Anditalea sp.]
MKNFLPYWICMMFCLSTSGEMLAQEPDSLIKEPKKEVYDFIILSGKIHNTFTFLGRDFGQAIPFVSTDVMYYFNSGWFINSSGFKFLDTELPLQSSLSVGYQREISSYTNINFSYSQFLVSGNSSVAGIQNLGFLQSTFGWDWNYMYSTIQAQFLFSENPDFFFVSQHSRYFQFDQKLFNKITVSFEPKFSLTAGTSRYYLLGEFPEREDTASKEMEKIQLLNWDFSLPVSFGLRSLDLEIFTKYVSPLNVPEFDSSSSRFVYGLQLNYFVPVKRKK